MLYSTDLSNFIVLQLDNCFVNESITNTNAYSFHVSFLRTGPRKFRLENGQNTGIHSCNNIDRDNFRLASELWTFADFILIIFIYSIFSGGVESPKTFVSKLLLLH